ncbi:MAG TPA: RidA family protein [Nonomuraea sp.]|nr:RidA family protein [Nonomuraea sp.]
MAERRAILSGSTFEEQIRYARAVVDGDWVHVSGTTGFGQAVPAEYRHRSVRGRVQLRRRRASALPSARPHGLRALPADPARAFRGCAAAMLMCGLSDPRMKIEIEVYVRRITA